MIGFHIASEHLYGLPERSAKFLLKDTTSTDPYRMFPVDLFPHEEWDNQGLYSGIPYLTGHSAKHDEAIVYMSAAETWVDIL